MPRRLILADLTTEQRAAYRAERDATAAARDAAALAHAQAHPLTAEQRAAIHAAVPGLPWKD